MAFQITDYVFHCSPGHGILLPPGAPFPDGKLLILERAKPHGNACELLMILPRQSSITCWTSRQLYEENKPGTMLQKNVSGPAPQSQVIDLLYRLFNEATRQQPHWQHFVFVG